MCGVSRNSVQERFVEENNAAPVQVEPHDSETSDYYEEMARTRRAMANKPYPCPEATSNGHEDFVMSHDLTAAYSSRQDGLMGAPSSGGPSADEGWRPGIDLPAMSSTGQYYGTGELSPGGPSA
eukprot:2171302-Amphidinium_carterae.1